MISKRSNMTINVECYKGYSPNSQIGYHDHDIEQGIQGMPLIAVLASPHPPRKIHPFRLCEKRRFISQDSTRYFENACLDEEFSARASSTFHRAAGFKGFCCAMGHVLLPSITSFVVNQLGGVSISMNLASIKLILTSNKPRNSVVHSTVLCRLSSLFLGLLMESRSPMMDFE